MGKVRDNRLENLRELRNTEELIFILPTQELRSIYTPPHLRCSVLHFQNINLLSAAAQRNPSHGAIPEMHTLIEGFGFPDYFSLSVNWKSTLFQYALDIFRFFFLMKFWKSYFSILWIRNPKNFPLIYAGV